MKTTLLLFTLCSLAVGVAGAQSPAQMQPLHDAAFNGDLERARSLLEEGTTVDLLDADERTPLMWASFNGHTAVGALLLENGAAVNALETNGRSALMYASSGPFAGTVELLLAKGADVNVQGSLEGFTALMTAAVEGQVEVVRLLLAHGADPAAEDEDGDTAESFAMQNGHAQVVAMLRDSPPPAERP